MPKLKLNAQTETQRYCFKGRIFHADTDVVVSNEEFDTLMSREKVLRIKGEEKRVPYFIEVAPKRGRPAGSKTKTGLIAKRVRSEEDLMKEEAPIEEFLDVSEEQIEV